MLPSLNAGWIAATVCTIAFVILYPLAIAVIVRRKLHVSWRYFGYGALIFFLFQLISRVPAITIIQAFITPQLAKSQTLLYVWIVIGALTAALFEEVGRYVGYRWLMKREEKTWNKAVMYGLGHGGLESIVLIGGLSLLSLINIFVLTTTNLNSLPASQHAQVLQLIATTKAQPVWYPLLGAWERLWTLPFHVGMSVVVLQVFRRGQVRWLWLAILLHALTDMSVLIPRWLGGSINATLITEGVITLFGLLGLWLIWRLRDRSLAVLADETPIVTNAETVSPEVE